VECGFSVEDNLFNIPVGNRDGNSGENSGPVYGHPAVEGIYLIARFQVFLVVGLNLFIIVMS
jgi:hypothetical protein